MGFRLWCTFNVASLWSLPCVTLKNELRIAVREQLLPPANKVWGKVLFSQASFCPQGGLFPSRISVQGGLCPGSLCLGGLCTGGFCLRGFWPWGLCQGGLISGSLCPGDHCAGGLCPGGLCPGGFCLGVSVQGVAVKVDPPGQRSHCAVKNRWYASYWNAVYVQNVDHYQVTLKYM